MGPERKKNLQKGRCRLESMTPGLSFVIPETWSESMNVGEVDSQDREGTGTQMTSYPSGPLVSDQVLIFYVGAGQ